jgi:hypothetical protein
MKTMWKAAIGAILGVGLLAALGTSVNVHGNIINADTGYQLGGAAPVGHTLVGNGSEYVDSGSTTQQDEWFTTAGCNAGAPYNGDSACVGTVSLPVAMTDSNYYLNCTASYPSGNPYSGTTAAGASVTTSIVSSGLFSYTLAYGYGAGAPGQFTANITCHAHHN